MPGRARLSLRDRRDSPLSRARCAAHPGRTRLRHPCGHCVACRPRFPGIPAVNPDLTTAAAIAAGFPHEREQCLHPFRSRKSPTGPAATI
ncbi:hypothetical protein BDI4_690005 [Burkholderia diffusa]|nr:hypothetical protein BDI4_690005 [Burkholderia diffusa]